MLDEKKARPAGSAAGQAAENNAANTIPRDNYTTGGGPISRLLLHGQQNAIPLRHLTTITSLDGRTVRGMIAAERLAGVPILSDNSTGYFLPENEGERERFIRSMKHRAGEIMRAAEAIEKAGR